MSLHTARSLSSRLPLSYDNKLESSLGLWLDGWIVDGVRPAWQHGLANKLTASRLAIIPLSPLYFWMAVTGRHWSAFLVTVLVLGLFATDAVDGFVARHTDDVTATGKKLDPAIDKLATFAITLAWIAVSGQSLPTLSGLIILAWKIRLAVEIVLWAIAAACELLGMKPSADKSGKYKFHVDVALVVLGCVAANWGLGTVGWVAVVLTLVTIPLTLVTITAQLKTLA